MREPILSVHTFVAATTTREINCNSIGSSCDCSRNLEIHHLVISFPFQLCQTVKRARGQTRMGTVSHGWRVSFIRLPDSRSISPRAKLTGKLLSLITLMDPPCGVPFDFSLSLSRCKSR